MQFFLILLVLQMKYKIIILLRDVKTLEYRCIGQYLSITWIKWKQSPYTSIVSDSVSKWISICIVWVNPKKKFTNRNFHHWLYSPFHEISASWRECSLLLSAVKHSVQDGGGAWSEPRMVMHQGGAYLGLSPESFPWHIGNHGNTVHSEELYHKG